MQGSLPSALASTLYEIRNRFKHGSGASPAKTLTGRVGFPLMRALRRAARRLCRGHRWALCRCSLRARQTLLSAPVIDEIGDILPEDGFERFRRWGERRAGRTASPAHPGTFRGCSSWHSRHGFLRNLHNLSAFLALHVGIAVVGRRNEGLFHRADARPAHQVSSRAGFVVRAGRAAPAERLLADDGARGLVVDIEIPCRLS